MEYKKIITIALCTVFVGMAGIFYLNRADKTSSGSFEILETQNEEQDFEEENVDSDLPETEKIYVHICGAVKNPGVYEILHSARIADLIREAGGLLENAAGDSINQAQHLEDGQQIYIMTKSEHKTKQSALNQTDGNASQGSNDTGSGKNLVNINTADQQTLMTLTGIGEAKAQSIIAYREENGAFAKIEDIKNITGIKDGVFQKIKDDITV